MTSGSYDTTGLGKHQIQYSLSDGPRGGRYRNSTQRTSLSETQTSLCMPRIAGKAATCRGASFVKLVTRFFKYGEEMESPLRAWYGLVQEVVVSKPPQHFGKHPLWTHRDSLNQGALAIISVMGTYLSHGAYSWPPYIHSYPYRRRHSSSNSPTCSPHQFEEIRAPSSQLLSKAFVTFPNQKENLAVAQTQSEALGSPVDFWGLRLLRKLDNTTNKRSWRFGPLSTVCSKGS